MLKKTYVLEQKNLQLENEIMVLKNTIRYTIEIEDKCMQIEGYTLEEKDMIGQAMTTNEEDLESRKEIEIKTINNLLIHKINSFKYASLNVQNNFIICSCFTMFPLQWFDKCCVIHLVVC